MRALDLFSGIGGWTAAAAGLLEVAAAFDVSPHANAVYAHNWGLRPVPRTLAGLRAADLAAFGDTGWLLSPPCQPFTAKGARRDLEDPRCAGLLRLADLLPALRPPFVLLENVPPFGESRTRDLLLGRLRDLGYHNDEVLLCPTEFGIPNLRRRYYLTASLRALPPLPPRPQLGRSLADYLDPSPDPALAVPPALVARHGMGLDRVSPQSPRCACFGSSYGHALRRAGSYLEIPGGLRRFSPEEILRLLHFPPSFTLPPGLSLAVRYRLAGNSVNVAVLRWLLERILGGDPIRPDVSP
ncbi:MAG: DNA cytosine methyltransferase [Deltaproteobacteria bacterium]|nr:DNA cytosine methyltransferase [Deltaproteobacteria bacterium]